MGADLSRVAIIGQLELVVLFINKQSGMAGGSSMDLKCIVSDGSLTNVCINHKLYSNLLRLIRLYIIIWTLRYSICLKINSE